MRKDLKVTLLLVDVINIVLATVELFLFVCLFVMGISHMLTNE